MFYILRKKRFNAGRSEVAEAGSAGTKWQASAAAPSEGPEIRPSKLFYIRRFGPIMGMCLYELDASLKASARSAGSVTSLAQEPSIKE